MGFADVQLPDSFDTPKEADQPQPDTQVSEATTAAPKTEETQAKDPEHLDLDTLGKKLRIDGMEYDAKEIRKMLMRQSDYTRKTQELTKERETVEKERQFSENLYYDLRRVEQDPQKWADKFKEVYPEKYHAYLDTLLEQVGYQKQGVPPELLKKVNELEQFKNTFESQRHEAEVEKAYQSIDSAFTKYGKQYKYAQEADVLTYAQRLTDEGQSLDDKQWAKIFETCHNRVKTLFDTDYKQSIDQQKQANVKAKDTGPGGGIPGQAPERIPLNKVRDKWLDDLARS